MDKAVFPGMVAGAVMMGAGDAEPEKIYQRLERFLDSAGDIANGGDGRITDMEG